MSDAIATCESAILANDASTVSDSCLSIGPDFRDPEIMKLTVVEEEAKDNTFSNINGTIGFSNDTFPDGELVFVVYLVVADVITFPRLFLKAK